MIKVGVCGFCTSQQEIFEKYRLLEVQKTFYKPPREKTAQKWREKAPDTFEFTVKAWQIITHPASSPTYKRVSIMGEKDNFGFFRPTKEVFNAFETTARIARILRARIIIFQTPAVFNPTHEHVENMKDFFSSIKKKFVYVWESRGWLSDDVKDICEELHLIDGTDPFRRLPVTEQTYFRLHGSPPGKHMYSYAYTDADLEKILTFCKDDTYVLFNTMTMGEDALRFQTLLKPYPKK